MKKRRNPWWIKTIYDVSQRNIIRLKSEWGPVGENWWAKVWVAVLEDAGEKGRLTRAKTCARNGSGSRLRIETGQMRIGICCSGYTIRDVVFLFPKFKEDVWVRLISLVAADAALAGALLSGDFTEYFVEELRKENIHLLPKNFREITALCGCGDAHHLCIHVAAAWYLFAEVLDEDPWHLLMLHGLPKDELTRLVRELREIKGVDCSKQSIPKERLSDRTIEVPKLENPAVFFSMAGDPLSLLPGCDPDTVANPILLLGPAPANLGGKNISDRTGNLYPVIREYAEALVRKKEGGE
ncbi:MAG: hypothetical protein NTV68_09440 [Methanomicrobiales archaeon]|nr:hypothetical protein [Methanomicrobiales archaeon]